MIWLRQLLNKLEGNKTLIGFVMITIEGRVELPSYWAFDVLWVLLLTWTGYGVFDKIKRYRRKNEELRNKGIAKVRADKILWPWKK